MPPGSLSGVCSPPKKRPPLTGCAEKRSWPGDGRGCFLCIGSMIKGQRCSHRLMSTLLGRMLTNLQKHAHHAKGVQYATKSKGKVENGVKYVRGNFWPGLHFRDLEDLNTQALAWLNTTANPRVHGTTGEVPFTRLRSEGLQPADQAFTYDTSVLTSRRSSKDCVISYEGNLYSVPAAYARKTLQVKITEAGEVVICSEIGQELARHRV